MGFILTCLLIGLIPAFIAARKGHLFVLWWIYGALLFIIALPHAIFLAPNFMRKCPHCAEPIRDEAKVCRYCSREVPHVPTAEEAAAGECPHCKASIDTRLHTCPECGVQLKSYWA